MWILGPLEPSEFNQEIDYPPSKNQNFNVYEQNKGTAITSIVNATSVNFTDYITHGMSCILLDAALVTQQWRYMIPPKSKNIKSDWST